jgi:hypothetical protein
MQKHLLLLLFLVIPSVACAMEEDVSSSSDALHSWLMANHVSLSPMEQAQIDSDRFEKQLQVDWLQLFNKEQIAANPVVFLKYCYNQSHTRSGLIKDMNDCLLNKCKEARIDGYSAWGATIIAKDVFGFGSQWVVMKSGLILQLMNMGFQPTEKDRKLVAIKLYNVIPAEQKQTMIKTLLLLLHVHQEGNLAVLLYDVRRYIMEYVVHLHKGREWRCSLL